MKIIKRFFMKKQVILQSENLVFEIYKGKIIAKKIVELENCYTETSFSVANSKKLSIVANMNSVNMKSKNFRKLLNDILNTNGEILIYSFERRPQYFGMPTKKKIFVANDELVKLLKNFLTNY